METAILGAAAKEGFLAVLVLVVGYLLWRLMTRIQDEGKEREERMQVEAKEREERISEEARSREERIITEAGVREDRLMKLAEGLTQRIEVLADQYETIALDVSDIKAKVSTKG